MGNVEIPNWLEELPLAPEFRPTDTEFADPIAYISKIEKEASKFGICKIIPPLPKPSKKFVFSNLNRSLLKCPELGPDNSFLGVGDSPKTTSAGDSGSDGVLRAVFTTRQQELGRTVKKPKGTIQNPQSGVHKQVWQSGEVYTLEQFESKSKSFARSVLGMVKDVSPLVIEAMFWKAALEKPMYIEYANDVPGSAFGESKGQVCYSRRRQSKRTYYKSGLDSSVCKQTEMGGMSDTQNDESNGASSPTHPDTCFEMSKSVMTMSTSTPNEASQFSRENSLDANDDMQGTSGWKLSHSPWNLQVVARASGSLTCFMPDDIPGVTSPMVYIGMLFSWFAWHVEDHELHSLNFLHTGSSKTWYAVPGNYAFDFEEVIRKEGYGADTDHLAALKRLGEKTTLLPPEIVVASGIPCCRLVQNPGEFVVTFPRAYHVGFSHGFNCGEAANFGTPQWLRVAKEAAVRRAAMNHLPMLSHQQLLYLLMMSFISRVPRTLLPGVRSSRLRDRQKEEREFLVKQAFIEDMLQENKLLSILLGKEATKQAVLWNADLLLDSSKDCQLPALASTTGTCMADMSNNNISSADKSSSYLLDEMRLYMENMTDSYFDCDDLPCHFQTDSGALACVGCGILGFPFMTVIQPNEKLITELLPDSHHLVEDSSLNSVTSLHSAVSKVLSVPELSSERNSPDESLNKCNKGWNTSSKFLRPRVFCLEHAVQIVEMLHCKGGANVLIICHSDYPKMKAHAGAVAEEIHSAFDYNEVPLDVASQENLALIGLAIDGQEPNECEDWTSKLGINLQFCVNARNNSPSKQVRLTLTLGMQFYDKRPDSEFLSLNWQSQKTRSKRSNRLAQSKPSDGIQRKEDDQLEGRTDGSTGKKKLIQYSRRRFKSKQSCLSVASTVHEFHENSKNASSVLSGAHDKCVSKDGLDTENLRSDCAIIVDSKCNRLDLGEGYHEYQSTCKSNKKEAVSSTASLVNQPSLATMHGNFESPNNSCAEERFSNSLSLKETTEGEIKSLDRREPLSDDNPTSEHNPNAEVCDVPGELYAIADLNNTASLDAKMLQHERQVGKSEEKGKNQSTHISAKQPCEVSMETCPKEDSCIQFISDTEKEMEIQQINRSDKEVRSGAEASLKDSSVLIQECSQTEKNTHDRENLNGSAVHLSQDNGELESCELTTAVPRSNGGGKKKKRKVKETTKNQFDCNDFIRSPCERLRPRTGKISIGKSAGDISQNDDEKPVAKRARRSSEASVSRKDKKEDVKKARVRRPSEASVSRKDKKEDVKKAHKCDLDGCRMSFATKAELLLHKRNLCPHKGCGKKFSSHKYAMVHQKVHVDDRPLKCPWKGCSMSFKWAWARTEHIRVHTGEKPYQCKVEGCGLSFRFVSDFSRHRRKTGHSV